MADETTDKTISSTDSGFPGYLNFDTLRSDAIAYLGNLSGKIWTDYNVHDPGITILEALVYAVLDLGYRTNLPAVDLFTRSEDDQSPDNNFYTPAQILANNPLTILDFRKMLIDITGVKNAWLTIEDKSPVDWCNKEPNIPGIANNPQGNPCGCDYLNGLYHVFIELERDDFDLTKEKDADEYNDIIYKIKCALMAHRNLCEDFIDIKILCKLKIGLCADIELAQDAEEKNVYLKILEALRDFFSPAPKFYTLPQLLKKGKPIEDIFAGRPYNVKESYGFVDTDEFEQIVLRKKIHLSDVYHVLFDIEGVKNVRNLSWKICNNAGAAPDITKWELHLPENFIPEFDVNCSGFHFFKFGMKVNFDTAAANATFALNLSANGKILYTKPFPNLDSDIPQGVYRSDLADYYSIQNEFPHVYGIKNGDLASTASDQRKAQALQLQGFLLFFDQLLANYLTQLKNIRSLFAFSSSEDEGENHTYFINTLTDVPQLEKLLRFNSATDGSGTLGGEGSILAYPTGRKNLEDLIANGKIQNTDLDRRCNNPDKDDFPPYQFCYDADRAQAENQLRDDLLNGNFDPVVISNYNNCYFFYCFTSSPDFVLISKKYYSCEREARTAAASIKYLATFEDNYRSFIVNDSGTGSQLFSFDVELNINVYAKYLQLIAETPSLYNQRRQGFLNHLLSRFAEQFTDYALLSSGFLSPEQLQTSQIKAEENFLSHYPELSSNRGKAYNYKCNGWNNENISGFEKRVKALSGMQSWKKHYLCNFVVEKADEIYQLSISLFGSAFSVSGKMFTHEAGISSLNSLYSKLRNNPDFESELIPHEQKWSVYIKDDFGNKYSDQKLFDTKEQADSYVNTLHSVVSEKPDPDSNVFVSKSIYKILFKNYKGEPVEESKQKFDTIEDAQKYFNKIAPKITNYLNDHKEFLKIKKGLNLEKLLVVSNENNSVVYIDKNKFELKPVDVIQLDTVRKKFALLNDAKTIQFNSLLDFDSVKLADKGFEELLRLLSSDKNYAVEKDNTGNTFKLVVKNGDTDSAVYFQSFGNEEEAQNKLKEIFSEIISHTYQLTLSDPIPDNWEFKYQLKDPSGTNINFTTESNYVSESQAQSAATQFYSHISTLKIENIKNDVQLVLDHKKKIIARASLPDDSNTRASQLLQYHQELFTALNNPSKKMIEAALAAGTGEAKDEYIYKLVDKDNLIAKSSFVSASMADALDRKNDLINTFQAGYDYTKISFGWDVINERKDAITKKTWYHFLIKCNNVLYQKGTLQGQPLILFESTNGYESKEEAMQAFLDNYLMILRKAFADSNYGANEFISLTEILIHQSDDCTKNVSTVFIRPETLYEYDGNIPSTIKAITLSARSYPVYYISPGRYRFSLFNKTTESYDWRSTAWYATPEKAMRQFQFFFSLLNYSGNFYIEKNETDCRYRIYIRETLAISTRTFDTPAEAWGNTGVEKFICTAQTKNGFHNYLNRINCSYSFFVACGNTGLIHPCKYETPERRDAMLNKLYKGSTFNFFDLLRQDTDNGYILQSLDKAPLARLFIEPNANNQIDRCQRLIEIFEAMDVDVNFSDPKSKKVYLNDKNKVRIAEPVVESITQADWIKQIRAIRCYFPLFRKQIENAGTVDNPCEYFVQIKLPGVNHCEDDLAGKCPDKISNDDCKSGCYAAWKSDCCFGTCCDALTFYAASLKLMANSSNYKPVYECDCGYYGIALHTEEKRSKEVNKSVAENPAFVSWLCGRFHDPAGNIGDNQSQFVNKCVNEIVAINPQSYTGADIACEAVVRAKKLINSEGLHLVEHILLRPRCEEDCNCDYLPEPCFNDFNPDRQGNKNICHFPWKPGGDADPCAPDDPVCFTPGCDPYSFIATVALPAWPQRFRSAENKAVMEKLLQKETPAHVLLRILWLAPRDFCCFEHEFKNWNYRLAKKMCDTHYSNCDFLGLLFHKNFETPDDCKECVPCTCNDVAAVSCYDDEKEPCADFNLAQQLNALYCWNKGNYDTYHCENNNDRTARNPVLAVAKVRKNDKNKTPVSVEERQPAPAMDERQKYLVLQARAAKYRENIKKLADAKPGNKAAENALRFLSDAQPDGRRYDELINKILKNKPEKTKNIKGLTLKEKNILIHNVSWQYFDRVCLNEKKADGITMHSTLFNHLRKNKIDMNLLCDDWNSDELKTIVPEINFNEIKKVVI